jgi:hypothetical protein
MEMSFRKLLCGLVAIVVLGAIAAGVASANWEIEGKPFAEGQEQEVTYAIAAGNTYDLNSKVAGVNVTLTGTGFSCFGFCKVDQNGVIDDTFGKVKLTGGSVDEPKGCSVPAELVTNTLKGEIKMDPSGGEATFLKLAPESGETLVEIEFTGGTCALAGVKVPLKGTLTGRWNNTGVSAVEQPITFSAAEQTTGGGVLKLGKEAATFTTKVVTKLSGANAGKKWSVK